MADLTQAPAAPEPLPDSEQAEVMAHDALVYDLSVALMRLDGNDGDPHQLLWSGGTVPEPWGDAWQRYEPQAEAVLNAIGEGSARALVDALSERDWVAQVVSSGPHNFPLLQWHSADVSLGTAIGTKLYLHPLARGLSNELLEGRNSQHVLKAEGASPDATDRENCAMARPDGGPMGAGQAAAAAPAGAEPSVPNDPECTCGSDSPRAYHHKGSCPHSTPWNDRVKARLAAAGIAAPNGGNP